MPSIETTCISCAAERCKIVQTKLVTFIKSVQFVWLRENNAGPASNHPLASEGEALYKLNNLYSERPPAIELALAQGFGIILTVSVGEFEENLLYKTKHSWMSSSGRREYLMPRLCLLDMQKTRKAVEEYINKTSGIILTQIISSSSDVVKRVLGEARKYSRNNKVSCHPSLISSYQKRKLMTLLEFHRSLGTGSFGRQSDD